LREGSPDAAVDALKLLDPFDSHGFRRQDLEACMSRLDARTIRDCRRWQVDETREKLPVAHGGSGRFGPLCTTTGVSLTRGALWASMPSQRVRQTPFAMGRADREAG
jgi:hypothetical protein